MSKPGPVLINLLGLLVASLSFLIVSSCYIFSSLSPTKIAFPLLVFCLAWIFLVKNRVVFKFIVFDWSVLFMLIVAAGGQLLSIDMAESSRIFISYVYYFLFYFGARIFFYNEPELIERAMYWVLMSAGFSALLGVFQVVTGAGYMPSTEMRSILTEGARRACGMFDDPNYFGFVLVSVWPLIYISKSIKNKSIFMLFLLFAVSLTLSRASILVVLVQYSTLMYFRSRNKLFFVLRIFLVVVVGALIVAVFQPEFLLKRFSTLAPLLSGDSDNLENSAAERIDLVFAGMKMFQEHYITGVGFGTFQLHSSQYMSFFPRKVFAHNTYLTVAAETGVVGFIIFVVPLIWMARALGRIDKMYVLSMIGVLLSYFFLVANYFPFLAYLFALYGAVIGVELKKMKRCPAVYRRQQDQELLVPNGSIS